MSTYDGNPLLFPGSTTVPDDGNDIDATNEDVPIEAALDRTAFLARRLLPSGVTAFAPSPPAVPADLTAITGMGDLETRHIPEYGMFIYRSASTAVVDGTWVINGHAGAGRWIAASHYQANLRLIKSTSVWALDPGITPTLVLHTQTFNAPDPIARAGGNIGLVLCNAGTFDVKAGDQLLISWALDWYLQGTDSSDLVVGVGYETGTVVYPSELYPLINQTGAAVPIMGPQTGGITQTQSMSRSAMVVATADQPGSAIVTVACEHTLPKAILTSTTTLSVAQYRCLL